MAKMATSGNRAVKPIPPLGDCSAKYCATIKTCDSLPDYKGPVDPHSARSTAAVLGTSGNSVIPIQAGYFLGFERGAKAVAEHR